MMQMTKTQTPDKHLLLTVSDGTSASYTLRFVRSMLTNFCGIKLTLFYVAPRALHWDISDPQQTPSESVAKEISGIKRAQGTPTLNKAKQWLMDVAECESNMVETKIATSRKGVIHEIIDEARKGLYDSVVIGRKAFSWFEALFEDSLSHELLWKNIDFPIWICKRPPETPRHNLLLCVDGSNPSLRMADHVGFMLAGQEEHTVTVFHAAEGKLRFGPEVDEMFNRTSKALMENGLPESRIEFKAVRSSNPANAIMKENREREYAAVALGKRGTQPTKLETFFPSSLSIKLLRLLDETALWISK